MALKALELGDDVVLITVGEQGPSGNGSPGTVQYWAKAFPGLRELQVLRELGPAAIVSSICARNVTNVERPDFGYRPAMAAIVERLPTQFEGP